MMLAIVMKQGNDIQIVAITVTNSKIGTAKLTSYPYRPKRKKYQVPLYRVSINGKDKSGKDIEEEFKAIRFGVKRTEAINAHVVSFKDTQS